MENTEVAVTSTATSASSSDGTVKSFVDSRTPTSSESKRTAKKGSVKSSRSTSASSLKSTAKKNYIASDTEVTFRYVLPQINLPPDIKLLDDSQKVPYSYKKSVEENTKVSVTDIAPTASSSKYTMPNSCLQPNIPVLLQPNIPVYRYYLPPMTPQPEIKRPDGNQKVSYSCEKSVKENTKNSVSSIASTSSNAMDNSSLQSSSKDLSGYVFPQKNLQPEIKRVDDGQKTFSSFTIKSVLENTKTSATSIIAPTTPTSSNVMDSSSLQSLNKYLDRYVLPQTTHQPENKRLYDSQKVSYSYKELVENTKASVPSRASTSSNIIDNSSLQPSNKDLSVYVLPQKNLQSDIKRVDDDHKTSTLDNSSLQSSNNDLYRYVLPQITFQPEIKRPDDTKKTPHSFKIRSGNTKTSVGSIIAPTAFTSSNGIDISSSQSRSKGPHQHVVPERKLQPETKRLDYSQKASNSRKKSVKKNKKTSVTSTAPTTSSSSTTILEALLLNHNRPHPPIKVNSYLQSSRKDLPLHVLPQINLLSETKRLDDDNQKTSYSFKTGSFQKNTKLSEAIMIAPNAHTSSNVIDNGSLQLSNKDLTMRGTHHTTTQDILPKAFKPVILQNNGVKNPDPIGTGSLMENSEVACTGAGPVAISSKKTVGSCFYVVDGDGKLSLIVMDDSGEPTGQMKFRNGVPDEQLYPVNFTESHKPDMAAIRHCIETALRNSANAEDSYQNHIEESRKVGIAITELEKMSECKLSRGLDLSRNGKGKDIPPYDKLQEQLQTSKEILHNLDKDILNLKEDFKNIDADRVSLERTLSTMQNRQLSFAESAEALNATRVMDLWLIRAQKLLQTSVDRIVVFYSIRDEMIRMLEQM